MNPEGAAPPRAAAGARLPVTGRTPTPVSLCLALGGAWETSAPTHPAAPQTEAGTSRIAGGRATVLMAAR
jgi:hypothetical protein